MGGDHPQVGPRREVRLIAALFPVAQRREVDLVAQRELLLRMAGITSNTPAGVRMRTVATGVWT